MRRIRAYRLIPGGGVLALGLGMLAGCTVGPDYHKPVTELPAAWQTEAPWRPINPADAADKGPWWQRYDDPVLNDLEQQALKASPTLELASARLNQARATVNVNEAGLLPQLSVGTRDSRLKSSRNRPLTNYATPQISTVQNDFTASFNASYELDLFGRVDRALEGARASEQQSEADFANTRLVLTAELAADYVDLRELDTELDVVNRSIGLQRRALTFVSDRRDLGAASGSDVAQQQALLDSTLTQVNLLRKQRFQYEHAIGTLIGTPAPNFSLAVQLRDMTPPAVPIGIPSDILEHRPDVASAERAMAAANAQIGVAKAAFYPSIVLQPGIGLESTALGTLAGASSLMWSLGVSATQVIFDGGRIRAQVNFAQGGYQAAVATYRRTVLAAMEDVEDGITGLSTLESASNQANVAVASARRLFDMASARYSGGATTYLDVITAQQTLLSAERQAAQISGQRLLTSVVLIKALGGDWSGPGTPNSPVNLAAAK